MPDDFAERLAAAFPGSGSAAALSAMVGRARLAWEQAETHQEAAPLLDLAVALGNASGQLRAALLALRRLEQVAGRAGRRAVAAAHKARIEELDRRLGQLSRTALLASNESPRPPANRPKDWQLYALVDVVAGYWKDELGRKVTNTGWVGELPKSEAARFVHAVVEHIAPGQGRRLRGEVLNRHRRTRG